ncbi:hypothetical protein [uncultured Enterococcus sp.]|nr:hypothetical protein [uncultured Enterococcus sp.]
MNYFLGIYLSTIISMLFSIEEEKVSVKGVILGSIIGYLVMSLL